MAGKTGTTSDNVDAWFVGYVPQVATAVWVGYDPARPMSNVHHRSVTGGSYPAAIFGDLMRRALKGVPAKDIPTASPEELRVSRLGPGASSTTTAADPESTTTTPTATTTSAGP